MAIDYKFSIMKSYFFKNAYSYVKIRVTPPAQSSGMSPFYVFLSDDLVNNSLIQRVFTPAPDSLLPPNDIYFDIFFPLFEGMTSLNLMVYPQNTAINAINDSTPSGPISIPITNMMVGNAFLLGLEDKEKNVRVSKTANSPGSALNPPISYVWTGTSPDDISLRIAGCVAHITSFSLGKIFDDAKFSNNGKLLSIYRDPTENGKAHIYIQTDSTGSANLTISPGNAPTSAMLVYWPFAGQVSEVARIVIYNPSILADDYSEAVPIKNPFTFTSGNDFAQDEDEPIFTIRNNENPPLIKKGNRIYILINDHYDSNFPTTDKNIFKIQTSKRFIVTSKDNPAANNIRYIYIDDNGTVNTVRQYAFFCYGEQGAMASSNVYNFDTILSGNNEISSSTTFTPTPVSTSGTGNAKATYNTSNKQLIYNIRYDNLSSAITMVHFHGPATANQSTSVRRDLSSQINENPIKGSLVLTDAEEKELLSGLWYCNIHTSTNPGGELRGQMWPLLPTQ